MKEALLDLWTTPADAKCITTNGYVKVNGNLVMGAGVAGQAQARYPNFPKVAGRAVTQYGNIVHAFRSDQLRQNNWSRYNRSMTHGSIPVDDEWFITFPVKHVWYENADLELIKRSAHQLMDLLNEPAFLPIFKTVLLPRPGCGNGHLTWEDVKPVIEPILDDRVTVITTWL